MNSDAGEALNDADDPLVRTLGDLLREKVTVATLATAIENAGIYGWDRYGRIGPADESLKKRALDLLAKQLEWEGDPLVGSDEDPRSPLELSEDSNGPFGSYGWPIDRLPDFEAISPGQFEMSVAKGAPAKRKAPDKFVAALISLLVKIAKMDPSLNCSQMPGTKADFHALAIKFDDLECALPTFETYIKPLIKFKRGSRSSDYYRKLFPEYFK